MENLIKGSILTLAIFSAVGCVANQPRSDAGDGQAVTGHKVTGDLWGTQKVVEFSTAKRMSGKLWAVMPEKVLSGEVSIASIFWHGDDSRLRYKNNPFKLDSLALQVGEGVIAVYRPHSTSKYDWRSMDEIRLHLALVEYLSRTFRIQKFNLYGKSGGGLLATAIAQERPHLTATVGTASPKLAVGIHYQRHEGGVPARYYRQYDPIKHIGKLSPEIPVLVVYDLRDRVVQVGGVLPYTKRAAELGLKIKLVEVQADGRGYHGTTRHLGHQLKRPENMDFWPR